MGHWIPENGQGHPPARPGLLWGTEAVLFSEDFPTDFWVLEPKDLFLYNLCGWERAPSGSHAASCTKDMLQKHAGQDTNGETRNQMIQCWLCIFSQLPVAQGLSQCATTACLVNNPPCFSLLQNYLKKKKKKKWCKIAHSYLSLVTNRTIHCLLYHSWRCVSVVQKYIGGVTVLLSCTKKDVRYHVMDCV